MLMYRDVHPEIKIFSYYAFFGLSTVSVSVGIAAGFASGRGQPLPEYLGTVSLSALLGLIGGVMVSGFFLPAAFLLSWFKAGSYKSLPVSRATRMEVANPNPGAGQPVSGLLVRQPR